MDRDEILAWVRDERLGLADFLDTLDADDWRVTSLCSDWTMHELAAHLTTSTRTTLRSMIKGAIRARGDFDRMNADEARELAARFTPAELIAQVRETAGSARRAPLAAPLDPLVDVLVHGQDAARPLGRVREMPTERALAALGHVLSSPFYGARKRCRGTRLVATDAEWSAGTGPDEVRGPTADLLLLATGRPAGLTAVSGPGRARIASAL
ncbi:maleylpyruvate isomerase family mycothiol-dependent enzyme (plasmid) [Embleya sp. NBC_00888]|uniref:maleylpyruvate isomerase family mycothiol-dependent enzyme n=1 Tax=Embleya sp. NBC_00888 TaxID=2975960 RepID=UPI002F91A61A|nr:maleylpyruvate isomerase family mycothiol-dependent enzyme [Embleya sp. NBC_00888]